MKLSFDRILALSLLLIISSVAFAVTDKAIKIVSSTDNYIDLQFKLPQLEMKTVSGKDGQFKEFTLNGAEYSGDAGYPSLPFFAATIAIPATGKVEYTINNSRVSWLDESRPVPAQDKENVKAEDWVINRSFYNGTGVYPSKTIAITDPAIMRDFRIVNINLYPLQWDAATNRMKVVETADIRINFVSGRGENEFTGAYGSYSPVFSNLYEQTIDNFEYYRNEDLQPVNPRILIIYGNVTATDFQTRLTDLMNWKRQKGYLVTAVSTSATGTGTSNIKSYIQSQYNNLATRPDYLILLGDVSGTYGIPSWTESWSTYAGEGDYPYTKLAGNDELGDCFIGRMSVTDISQLDVLLAKMNIIEKNINVNLPQAAWLNRMLLVGDPGSSGVSTITTSKYIKELAEQVNPNYAFTEVYSGSFAQQMNTAISGGVGIMNYRGYWGMSSWNSSGPFTNTNKLPHAVMITCGTGSYNATSDTETFIRLGSTANPTGGATAIGMATIGTHTGLNNSLCHGIFQGIFGNGIRTMGEALLAGRLNVEKVYGVSDPTHAHYFAHWCNLMGDPTLEVYTGIPGTLTINVPTTIPSGTSQLELTVLDGTGTPVRYASVTAYSANSGVVGSGFTNADGNVSLTLPALLSGTIKITAAKHNYKPIQSEVSIDNIGSVVINAFAFDDDSNGQSIGNGDFMLNAGETVECSITLKNSSATDYSNLTGTLSTTNPNVNILNSNAAFPDLLMGITVQNAVPFVFSLANNINPVEDIRFALNITDGTNSWSQFYHVSASNLRFAISAVSVMTGLNAVLDPGETAQLRVVLQNPTTMSATGITAEIISSSDMVDVLDSTAVYGDIIPNSTANPQTEFTLTGLPQLIPGMQIPMQLRIYNSAGFNQVLSFNLPIGTPNQHTPLGPDAYGYFIYDVTDTSYPDAPQYSWMEIAPSLGGNGVSLNLSDVGISGDEGDQGIDGKIAVVDLPFTFGFYGLEYNQISVSVNGFIVMGVSENHEFRNYHLPGAGGPSPMIAAFWDDLCTNGGGQVYRYFDAAQHIFVIQYQNMKNGYNRSSEETFQILFYDPAFYPSGMGDGIVKIQYKIFNNIDIGAVPNHGNYSTIGIRDHSNTIGLEYTYDNVYPAAAAPLGHQTALLITTIPVIHQAPYIVVAETIAQDSNNNNIVEPGEMVEMGIQLNNLGTNAASNVIVTMSTTNQYATVVSDTTSYPVIAGGSSAMNNSTLKIQILPNCPDNQTITLNCHIAISGNSWDRQVNLIVRKPALAFESYYINDFTANGNGMADPGESFIIAVNLSNPTDLPAKNVTATLSTTNTHVMINAPQGEFFTIPPQTVIQKAFAVTFAFSVPLNTLVPFNLNFSGDLIQAQNAEFTVGCGISGLNLDFEQNNGNMEAIEPNGWAWGTDATTGSHSGTHVWGTVLGSDYPSNAHYELVSPDAMIGANSWLEFYHWYRTENSWDGGNIKISNNNGLTWILLVPEGGYNDQEVNALNEPGFTGSLTNWTLVRYNLSAYANSTVKIKWTFASDNLYNDLGWYIDDVKFTGALTNTGQVNGQVTLGSENIPLTDVVVAAGQTVATHPAVDGSYTIYLPQSTYNLTASLAGHQNAVFNNVAINNANPMYIHDFYLAYYNPVEQITPSNSGNDVLLSWTAPQDPEFPVVYYKVYKRYNSGRFDLLTQTTNTSVLEAQPAIGQYQYYIVVNYGVGESVASDTLSLQYPLVGNDDNPGVIIATALYGNYPNPFNPTTTIAFAIQNSGNVILDIYNVKGQMVKNLLNANLNAGAHNRVWDGRDNCGKNVGSGIYFYRMQTGNYTKTMKAILVK